MDIPWYDAHWLKIYNRARTFLRETDPDQLAVFESSLRVLSPPAGFKTRVLPRFFDEPLLSELRALIAAIPESEMERHELLSFGRFILHNHPRFNQLQFELTDLVSELCGEQVEPSYNFLSLYNNLGVCEPHMDSPHSKWTLDVCIDQSERWPIYISDSVPFPKTEELDDNWKDNLFSQTNFDHFESEPGDGLLFAGSHQWHYRERIAQRRKQNFCHLIFFHFVPVAHKPLIDPRNWPDLLGIPALKSISSDFDEFNSAGYLDSANPVKQP